MPASLGSYASPRTHARRCLPCRVLCSEARVASTSVADQPASMNIAAKTCSSAVTSYSEIASLTASSYSAVRSSRGILRRGALAGAGPAASDKSVLTSSRALDERVPVRTVVVVVYRPDVLGEGRREEPAQRVLARKCGALTRDKPVDEVLQLL